MYRQQSRPKEVARRVFVYFIMTASMITLLVILTLTIIGYRFNFDTRTVEQTGLVQFDSFPRGARVNIDGKIASTTQTKSMVLPGQRQFSMQLKGYSPWQKTVSIEAGTVTWLSYVRLVPEEKQIESVHSFTNLQGVMTSSKRRYMAGFTKNPDGLPEIVLIDFDNSKQPKINQLALETEQLTHFGESGSEHDLAVISWSQSERFMLVRHNFKLQSGQSGAEWLWLDRETPTKLTNIQRLVNLPIKNVRLTDDKEVFILQDNGDIRQVTLDNGVISRPLITDVSWFDVDDKTKAVSFISTRAHEQSVGIYKKDWSNPVVLLTRPVDDKQPLHIRVSRYFHKDTVVIGDGPSMTIYRGSLPYDDEAKAMFVKSASRFTLNRAVDNLQISGNGQFVIAEDEAGFISYDLERLQVSQEIKKYNPRSINWLDTHHIWQIDESGQLIIQEFDGVNSHQLMPVSANYDVLLTKDGKYTYGFALTDVGSVELMRLNMLTN